MIATRLHAKRLSSLTVSRSNILVNRPSVTSIHGTSHIHVHEQRRRTSQRPSDAIQNIDSDNEDDNENEVREDSKVEPISYTFFFRLLTPRTSRFYFESIVLNIIFPTIAFIDHFSLH